MSKVFSEPVIIRITAISIELFTFLFFTGILYLKTQETQRNFSAIEVTVFALTPALLVAASEALRRFSYRLSVVSVSGLSLSPALPSQITETSTEQGIPESPMCPVCSARLIVDAHYQLCQECKSKYASEIQRVRVQRYRTKRLALATTLTASEWINTLQSFHFLCAYCQVKPYAVLDHIMPVSKGGGTTKENCVPACVHCNGQKHAIHPELINQKVK